jgi:hypothetical protein
MIEKTDKFGKWQVEAHTNCNIEHLVEPSALYFESLPQKPIIKHTLDLEALANKLVSKGIIDNKADIETKEVINNDI